MDWEKLRLRLDGAYALASPLHNLLVDPKRRRYGVLVALIGYVLLWTFYGVVAKSSQDLHFDIGELVGWSREFAFGYSKHPPLTVWIVRVWFSVLPVANWTFFLLALCCVGIGLWAAYRISERWLDPEKQIAALAILTLIPLLNFHALIFNANVVLIPLWAWTTFWFLRSLETSKIWEAGATGLFAGASMLGKYWSIYLVAGLLAAALFSPRRREFFLSSAPWVALTVFGCVLAPHVVWLFDNNFISVRYALDATSGTSQVETLRRVCEYIFGALAYIALPLVLLVPTISRSRVTYRDVFFPRSGDRRVIAVAFYIPLLLPGFVELIVGGRITSLWTMSSWTLLPILLLSSEQVVVTPLLVTRFIALAVVFPIAALAAAPFVALVTNSVGVKNYGAHYRLLAEETERAWKAFSPERLPIVAGNSYILRGLTPYFSERPTIALGFEHHMASRKAKRALLGEGAVLLCATKDVSCTLVQSLLTTGINSRAIEADISRKFWGFSGPIERYSIVLVPKQ